MSGTTSETPTMPTYTTTAMESDTVDGTHVPLDGPAGTTNTTTTSDHHNPTNTNVISVHVPVDATSAAATSPLPPVATTTTSTTAEPTIPTELIHHPLAPTTTTTTVTTPPRLPYKYDPDKITLRFLFANRDGLTVTVTCNPSDTIGEVKGALISIWPKGTNTACWIYYFAIFV